MPPLASLQRLIVLNVDMPSLRALPPSLPPSLRRLTFAALLIDLTGARCVVGSPVVGSDVPAAVAASVASTSNVSPISSSSSSSSSTPIAVVPSTTTTSAAQSASGASLSPTASASLPTTSLSSSSSSSSPSSSTLPTLLRGGAKASQDDRRVTQVQSCFMFLVLLCLFMFLLCSLSCCVRHQRVQLRILVQCARQVS